MVQNEAFLCYNKQSFCIHLKHRVSVRITLRTNICFAYILRVFAPPPPAESSSDATDAPGNDAALAFRGAAGVGRRRLRGRSSATSAVAADAKDRNSKNRRRRRRLFKTFVVQDVITHAVLSPGQQLIIDAAPSNRSKKKPQPTPRHCRLTGLNHALTYSNLAPISCRSEKLRRSPCTGHQV